MSRLVRTLERVVAELQHPRHEARDLLHRLGDQSRGRPVPATDVDVAAGGGPDELAWVEMTRK